uniref:CUB domain-containing protein n=1 Tax=Plectus sambesii TaxID=2011161 RepID=A0A914W8N0_9BILA
MADTTLILHVLLILSAIGGSAYAASPVELDSLSPGCSFSIHLPSNGSSQTFDAIPPSNCQDFVWHISGTSNAAFALIFTDFSLSQGEFLSIYGNQLPIQTCDSPTSCSAVLIQPTPNVPPTVSLMLQNHRQSVDTKRFTAVMSSIGMVLPVGRSQDIYSSHHRSDCDGQLPAWGIVLIVFIVFFFLTIMCCTAVRCCKCRRQCARSGQVIASAPLPNGPPVASFQDPSVIAAPPPPSYPSDGLPDNFLNQKFEMYNNTLKH